MEKIVIEKELGKALLAFRSTDKTRMALNSILVTETGAFCTTDETPAGAIYFKATGITALFMPFRTN
jgi:hypothetical protein